MRLLPAVLLVCGILVGCGGDPQPSAPAPTEAGIAPPPPPPPPAPPAAPGSAETGPAANAVAPAAEGRPAEVGVGRKGHGYGTGPIATPLAARWRAAERLVFEVQIPQAMNLYKATNGHAPKSHQEFMAQIIEFNRINLPELRPEERYQYDPETEQLMVVGAEKQ